RRGGDSAYPKSGVSTRGAGPARSGTAAMMGLTSRSPEVRSCLRSSPTMSRIRCAGCNRSGTSSGAHSSTIGSETTSCPGGEKPGPADEKEAARQSEASRLHRLPSTRARRYWVIIDSKENGTVGFTDRANDDLATDLTEDLRARVKSELEPGE